MDTYYRQDTNQSIYTPKFILLCVCSLFLFASFNMILPELPAYLTQLGGADYKGFIIALFTVTAGLSRPFSGKLVDKIGRKPLMILGAIFSLGCALLYPLISSVFAFFFVRLLHGFCAGTAPTATSAMLADIIPPNKRGEAMGLLGLISNLGTAFSPVIGSEIVKAYSINALFYTSSFLALLAGLLFLILTETLKVKEPFHLQHLRLTKKDVFEPDVLNPTIVMFLMTAGFGTIFTVMPDLSVHLGISNKGFPLMFYTICSLSVRVFAGKVSDKFGRITILRYALSLQIIALVLMGFANTPLLLYFSTSLFGFSMGFTSPTILAWAIDLSTDTNRGRAMATVYLAMEAGIGTGALLSAWIYDNNAAMFAYTFWAAAGFAVLGLIYVSRLYRGSELVKS